ncbi:GGDEF domain-containing protein [Paenibacillus sp. OAS669]|uniref:GGDEF domain-containing protein n=1 Tax=Paenibacillus sp. OAS669 TaxID=2663821 RepID=UPI00178BC64F|nr:GGDEF domain-containing protein [Paenibacillus sp. OAS669]MBE1446502.1 diguanylate cyclase (GGDEF)-like protein [Paenibacillus sp. OAS669]
MKGRIDEMTGLRNREALELQLKETSQECEGVALALIDVDHFLDINRLFGHDTGDHVLKTIADILKEQTSEQAVFRVSGDEFAVVLADFSLEQGFLKMESVRAAVQASKERFQLPADEQAQEISVTVGVAQYPRDAKDMNGLMRAANAALMSAKESGRNQVALPPNEEMVMKTCYYPATMVRQLKTLAEKLKKKESILFREALADLIRKYDR